MVEIKGFLKRLEDAKAEMFLSTSGFSIASPPPSKEAQEKTIKLGKEYEALKRKGHQLLALALSRTNQTYSKDIGCSDAFLRNIRAGKKIFSDKLLTNAKADTEAILLLIDALK